MEYRTLDGINIIEFKSTASIGGVFSGYREPTSQELELWVLNKTCVTACNLVSENYNTYCEQGLLATLDGCDYVINNNSKTRDEATKKLLGADKIDSTDVDYSWTMDTPRTKITFGADKRDVIDWLKLLTGVISSNEILLRDKKTDIYNMDLTQVNSFIANPTYPSYERTI